MSNVNEVKRDDEARHAHSLQLYPELVGRGWSDLSEPVQTLHGAEMVGGKRAGRGRVAVTSARGWIARMLLLIFAMPPAGEHDVTVEIMRTTSGGERWVRTFGGHPLITFQERAGAWLLERLGRVELLFELVVRDHALCFEQREQRLVFGRWRLSLPQWIAPRIVATAWGDDGSVSLSVEIFVPLIGVLLAYRGRVAVVEAA